jgi:hypothetical protein
MGGRKQSMGNLFSPLALIKCFHIHDTIWSPRRKVEQEHLLPNKGRNSSPEKNNAIGPVSNNFWVRI